MKNKTKPIVGQIVFSLNVGNAARGREQKLTRARVVSIGRKYFKTRTDGDATGYSEYEYHIDSWGEHTEFNATSCLYESEQEYVDERDEKNMCKFIFDAFECRRNNKSVPMDKLREIVRLIDGACNAQTDGL